MLADLGKTIPHIVQVSRAFSLHCLLQRLAQSVEAFCQACRREIREVSKSLQLKIGKQRIDPLKKISKRQDVRFLQPRQNHPFRSTKPCAGALRIDVLAAKVFFQACASPVILGLLLQFWGENESQSQPQRDQVGTD